MPSRRNNYARSISSHAEGWHDRLARSREAITARIRGARTQNQEPPPDFRRETLWSSTRVESADQNSLTSTVAIPEAYLHPLSAIASPTASYSPADFEHTMSSISTSFSSDGFAQYTSLITAETPIDPVSLVNTVLGSIGKASLVNIVDRKEIVATVFIDVKSFIRLRSSAVDIFPGTFSISANDKSVKVDNIEFYPVDFGKRKLIVSLSHNDTDKFYLLL